MLIIRESGLPTDYYDHVMSHGVDKSVVFRRNCGLFHKPHQSHPLKMEWGGGLTYSTKHHAWLFVCNHFVGGQRFPIASVIPLDDRPTQCYDDVEPLMREWPDIYENAVWRSSIHHLLNRNFTTPRDCHQFCLDNNIVVGSEAWCESVLDVKDKRLFRRISADYAHKFELKSVKINHPFLRQTGLPDFLSPEECYTMIYNFLLNAKQVPMQEISDKSKLTKAGFDKVVSFRHRKDR